MIHAKPVGNIFLFHHNHRAWKLISKWIFYTNFSNRGDGTVIWIWIYLNSSPCVTTTCCRLDKINSDFLKWQIQRTIYRNEQDFNQKYLRSRSLVNAVDYRPRGLGSIPAFSSTSIQAVYGLWYAGEFISMFMLVKSLSRKNTELHCRWTFFLSVKSVWLFNLSCSKIGFQNLVCNHKRRNHTL